MDVKCSKTPALRPSLEFCVQCLTLTITCIPTYQMYTWHGSLTVAVPYTIAKVTKNVELGTFLALDHSLGHT